MARVAQLDPATAGWVAHLDVDLAAAQAALRMPPDERPAPPGGVVIPELGEEWFAGELAGEPDLSAAAATLPAGAAPKASTLASKQPLRGAYARRARGQ